MKNVVMTTGHEKGFPGLISLSAEILMIHTKTKLACKGKMSETEGHTAEMVSLFTLSLRHQ
jgi:hypothetical protein